MRLATWRWANAPGEEINYGKRMKKAAKGKCFGKKKRYGIASL